MSTIATSNIDPTVALPLMEQFYTIQGEGFHQGKAAYFVRLAGCDVGCTWCDVKESWEAEKHPITPISEIIAKIATTASDVVVVTGGEPLMYDLTALTAAIKSIGKKTHIETSGAYPLTGTWDWICVSPKRFKKPLDACLKAANELKIIVAHQNDLRFAQQHSQLVAKDCIKLLQPEWSVESKVLPFMVDFVKDQPEFRITLQTHKYMQVP